MCEFLFFGEEISQNVSLYSMEIKKREIRSGLLIFSPLNEVTSFVRGKGGLEHVN